MGRWSQGRRRGTTPDGAAHLPLPPAPQGSIDLTGYLQTTNGTGDAGGSCKLYQSDTQFGAYTLITTTAYLSPLLWPAASLTADKWYRPTEVGNGINYAGESPPGPALQYVVA